MVANLHMNLKNGVHKALAMLETSIANLGRCPISGLTTNPGFCQLSLEAIGQEDLEVIVTFFIWVFICSLKSKKLLTLLIANLLTLAQFYEQLHDDYLRSYQISENSVSMFKRLTLNTKIPNTHELEPPSTLYHPITAPRAKIETFVATLNQRYSTTGNPVCYEIICQIMLINLYFYANLDGVFN